MYTNEELDMKRNVGTFNKNALGVLTKSIHQSQEKWRTKNWKETLRLHGNQIEGLIEKISLLDKWENALQNNNVCKMFIPEIFIDGWASVHLASFGLYKYANMSLRSELENSLRLVFFSTHPIEFKWWLEGNESYRSRAVQATHVWGQGYEYFGQLEKIKKLNKLCGSGRKLFKGKDSISNINSKLSKYIHSGAKHFQTQSHRVSPKYNSDKFVQWRSIFAKVQANIQVLMITQFHTEFKQIPNPEQKKILAKGVENYYANKLKKMLDI